MVFREPPDQLDEGDDFGRIMLADGSVVRAWATLDGVVMQQLRGSVVSAEVAIPYPRAGLGGGRLLLSPRERFVVLSYFSGQSEEGFLVVSLRGGLKVACDHGYVYGESAEFGFSAAEDVLVAFVPWRGDTWWPYEEDEFEEAEDGRLQFYLGRVICVDLGDGTAQAGELRGRCAPGVSPIETEWTPSPVPEVDGERVRIPMPWGEAVAELPVVDNAVVDAMPAGRRGGV